MQIRHTCHTDKPNAWHTCQKASQIPSTLAKKASQMLSSTPHRGQMRCTLSNSFIWLNYQSHKAMK